jgi:hypothetical protein
MFDVGLEAATLELEDAHRRTWMITSDASYLCVVVSYLLQVLHEYGLRNRCTVMYVYWPNILLVFLHVYISRCINRSSLR